MPPRPYIFTCAPLLVPKVWGGRRLEATQHKALPDDGAAYGEAWEVADLPEGASTIATGPLAGRTLTEAVDLWGEALVGHGAPGGRFPLLVKLLDASADLSVQVHPGPDDLASRPGARSKDECWVILDVADGGCVLHGFASADETPASFAQAITRNEAAARLRRVPVSPGDVLHVPPGCLHAICAGVVLLEVQEPSDTTYRVYDYDRPGLDGKPRALHLDDAMQVARFGEQPPAILTTTGADTTPNTRRTLVDAPTYHLDLRRLDTPQRWDTPPDQALVVFLHTGAATLHAEDTTITLHPGQTAIVPACIEQVQVVPDGEVVVMCGWASPTRLTPTLRVTPPH